jgi:hypothetical protein
MFVDILLSTQMVISFTLAWLYMCHYEHKVLNKSPIKLWHIVVVMYLLWVGEN